MWKKIKKGKWNLMLIGKGKHMFAGLKMNNWAKMRNPSKKMGLEASWEGPYYIFLRSKYDFSEQELNDEGALICILHVLKDRTFLRHHG
jgi:hypothetical protein